jgi:hypothetical protein
MVNAPLPPALVGGAIVEGPVLAEPVRIEVVGRVGDRVRLLGEGLRTGRFHQLLLDEQQLATVTVSPAEGSYDGDPRRFCLAWPTRVGWT